MFSVGSLGFLIILVVLVQLAEPAARIDPLVDTNVGLIRGLPADDGDYDMFLGIPYGQVDEDNPFGRSTPHPKFEETFKAYDDSVMCPQVYDLNNTILGSANCLHLNVYVPTAATTKNRLPVMVWIYGGSFQKGLNAKHFYGPKYLVKHDVILVTVNYRVGAYGFMCLNHPEIPGNQGLNDQYLALKWVKQNIEAFGGDTDKITLFGESAGGHSVDLHLISKKERLYNKVIMESGSSLASTVFYDPDREAPMKLAAHLGFQVTDINEAISFLAKTDPKLVVASANELNIMFKPCVETEFDGVESFLSESWINAPVPKIKNIPVLLGFNKNELASSYIGNSESYHSFNIIYDYLNQIFNFDDELLEEMKNLIAHFYFGDEAMNEDVKWQIIDLLSDYTYIHPVQRTIKKYLEGGAENIYYYRFSYVGATNAVNLKDNENRSFCCASHADELPYIFYMNFKPEHTDEDKLVIERMTTMWTNFAKFSDPTPQISKLLPVKWVPLTEDKYTYLNIDYELSLGSRPAHSRMTFWDLFYKLNEKLQKRY